MGWTRNAEGAWATSETTPLIRQAIFDADSRTKIPRSFPGRREAWQVSAVKRGTVRSSITTKKPRRFLLSVCPLAFLLAHTACTRRYETSGVDLSSLRGGARDEGREDASAPSDDVASGVTTSDGAPDHVPTKVGPPIMDPTIIDPTTDAGQGAETPPKDSAEAATALTEAMALQELAGDHAATDDEPLDGKSMGHGLSARRRRVPIPAPQCIDIGTEEDPTETYRRLMSASAREMACLVNPEDLERHACPSDLPPSGYHNFPGGRFERTEGNYCGFIPNGDGRGIASSARESDSAVSGASDMSPTDEANRAAGARGNRAQ